MVGYRNLTISPRTFAPLIWQSPKIDHRWSVASDVLCVPLRAFHAAALSFLELERAHSNTTNTQNDWRFAPPHSRDGLVFKGKCDFGARTIRAILERKIVLREVRRVPKFKVVPTKRLTYFALQYANTQYSRTATRNAT